MKVAAPNSPAQWISQVHIVDEKEYDPEVREVPVLCGSKWCWQQGPYLSCDVIEHETGRTYPSWGWFVGSTPPAATFCRECERVKKQESNA